MAICVRQLIEQTELFAGNRIAFVANNNMSTANTTSLTTIANLYDVLTIALDEFFGAKNTKLVVKEYRGSHGGHVLFRPIGLEIMTRVIARLT